MKKLTKILIGGAAVLLTLFIIATILTMLFFPAEKVKTLIEERGTAAMGMPVAVGDIGVSFLGLPALKVSDLTVGPPPGLTKPLAELKSLRVTVNILKLLSKQVEIVSIDIDSPQIHFIIPPEDSTAAEPEKADTAGESAMLPVPVTLRSLQLDDGYVEIINMDAQTRFILDEVSMKTSLTLSKDLSEMQSGGTLTVGDIALYPAPDADPVQGIDLTFVHAASGNLTTGDFTLEKGALTLNGLPVTITGSLRSWTTAAASVKTGDIDIRTVLDMIPGSLVPEKQNVSADGSFSLSVDTNVHMAEDVPEITYSGSLSLDMNSLAYEGFPEKIDSLIFKTGFTEKEIAIKEGTLVTGSSRLSLTGNVSDYLASPALAVNVSGEINVEDVTQALPLLEDGMTVKGIVGMDIAVKGTAEDLQGVAPEGSVTLQQFEFELPDVLNHAAALNGTMNISPDALTVKKFVLTSGASDISFNGALDNYKALLFADMESYSEFTGTVTSSMLDITDLIVIDETKEKPLFKPWQIEKPLNNMPVPPNAAASASARLGTVKFGNLKAGSVKASITLRDGVFSVSGLNVSAYNGVLTGSTTLNMSNPENVTYTGGFKLDKFGSGAFLAAFFNRDEFMSGSLSSNLTFSGAGLDSVSMLDNLTADGDMLFEGGEIYNLDFTKKLGAFLKFLDFDVLTFDSITNTFMVKDRKVITPDMSVKSDHGTILMNGSAGFDTSLDYVMTLILNKEASAKAVNTLGVLSKLVNKDTESIELDVGVKGTMKSPSFTLDTSKAEQKLKEQAKDKIEEKAKEIIEKNIKSDDIKEEGKKILKQLFR